MKSLSLQGYVPDGIYTYATDSAVVHDLSFMKALGGRMIRKHAKVGPSLPPVIETPVKVSICLQNALLFLNRLTE